MSGHMLSIVWHHSRSRGLAYALLQAIADNIGDWKEPPETLLTDEWLMAYVRITPAQFKQAREQLRHLGELDYRYDADPEGRTAYRMLLSPPPPAKWERSHE